MPTYEFQCDKCEGVSEDILGINDPPPEVCPLCEEKNCLKKIISLPAQGKVELTGHELKAQLKQDAQKMKKDILGNENKLANALGEEKFQKTTVQREKVIKDLGNPRPITRSK